jgi:hypothetical protein
MKTIGAKFVGVIDLISSFVAGLSISFIEAETHERNGNSVGFVNAGEISWSQKLYGPTRRKLSVSTNCPPACV